MATYRNRNTDDVVSYDEPSPRLEALDNWDRIDEPESEVSNEPEPSAPRRRKP